MIDDDYDHAAEDVSVNFSLLTDHTEARRRVAFLMKRVTYPASGKEFRTLVVREYFGAAPARSREVQVPRGALPALARALEMLASPPPAAEPAPVPAPTPPPSQPGVLRIDDATRARLGVTVPTTTPQPERPRRVPPLPPAQRMNGGR